MTPLSAQDGTTGCCPDCARFDQWVASIGGIAGRQFAALRAEALEFAGPDGYSAYLAAAQAIDEEHAAAAGRWLAREIDLANAESTRQAAEDAAAAALEQADEIKLAVERLRDHPRLAADPDFGAGPGMGSAEVAYGLRVAMGLANRPSTPYEESLPPVADLGRRIGVRR